MTRTALFAALLVGSASLSRADDVEVAPPPREVGADGNAPPAPAAEPAARSANPVETVEKIIKNSKSIADRLAESDAGDDTRKTQDQTLALIDSLLNRENPPPKSDNNPEQDKDKDKNPDQNPDQKKDEQDPSGGAGMKDMPEPKGGKEPMGGSQDRPRGERRPRGGSGQAKADQQPKPGGGKKPKAGDQGPKGTAKEGKANPMSGGAAGAKKKDDPAGGTAGRAGGVPKGPPQGPSLPLADEVVKDVWGHLPDRERQQITQFYREQFMPRYSDLIKQYFSSLAENSRRSAGEMRR